MDTESVRSSYSHRSLASHVSYRSAYSQMARPPNANGQVILGPGGQQGSLQAAPRRHRPGGASSRRMAPPSTQQPPIHTFGPNTAPSAAVLQNGNPLVQETRPDGYPPQVPPATYMVQQETAEDDDDRALSIVAPADATKVRLLMDNPEKSKGSLYWNDSHTVITGATSDTGLSFEDLHESGDEREEPNLGPKFHKIGCSRYCPMVFGAILCLFAFLTPVAMIILPTLGLDGWTARECTTSQCEGMLISMAVKLLLILLTTCLIFFRHQTVTLPRVNVFKSVVLLIVSIVTFAFWLFYGVKIFQARETDFSSILSIASSFADVLLFLCFMAVVGLELRHLEPTFCLKIVRSPDGECRYVTIGRVSIQRAAAFVLQQYFRQFPYYNPFLESAIFRTKAAAENAKGNGKSSTSYKFYDIDGLSGPPTGNGSVSQAPSQGKASRAGSVVNGDVGNGTSTTNQSSRNNRFRRRGASHNERFYAEEDYDRRLRKRRARLVVATDEAFSHIRRLNSGQSENSCRDTPQSGQPLSISPRMEPTEAAQTIFPAIARPLEKYLSATRQQLRYTTDAVIEHLSACLANDLGPRAFLERYFEQEPSLYNDREYRSAATWLLASESLVSRSIGDGITFRLRPVDNPSVYLMVTCRKLPHFNVLEEVVDSRNNKLTIRITNANSETSV